MKPNIEERVTKLENNENNNTFQKVVNRLIQDVTDVDDDTVTVTVSDTVTIPSGGGSDTVNIDVIDFPDKWLRILYNGRTYRIPAYLESEDSSR